MEKKYVTLERLTEYDTLLKTDIDSKLSETTYTIGENITNTDGTLSLTQSNVIGALGYSPILYEESDSEVAIYTGEPYIYHDEITVVNNYDTGWLKTSAGGAEKNFAPNTLLSQVYDKDGVSGSDIIQSLDNEVTLLSNDVEGVNATIEELNGTINGLNVSITEKGTSIDLINQKIEEIKTNIEEVNAAIDTINSTHNIKIYSSLTQLGFTASATTAEVFAAMPDYSILECGNNTTSALCITDVPNAYTLVRLSRSGVYGGGDAMGLGTTIGYNSAYKCGWHSTGGLGGWKTVTLS